MVNFLNWLNIVFSKLSLFFRVTLSFSVLTQFSRALFQSCSVIFLFETCFIEWLFSLLYLNSPELNILLELDYWRPLLMGILCFGPKEENLYWLFLLQRIFIIFYTGIVLIFNYILPTIKEAIIFLNKFVIEGYKRI